MKSKITCLLLTAVLISCKEKYNKASGGLLLPILDSVRTIPLAASAGARAVLPRWVDMEKNLPPAGMQGNQGSCVSWAIGYDLISYYHKSATHGDYGIYANQPDPMKVFSPAFIYNYVKNQSIPYECQTGILFTEAFKTVKSAGVCRWKFLPYQGSDNGCHGGLPVQAMQDARSWRNFEFERIPKTRQSFKFYISAGYPIITGLFTSKNMYKDGINWTDKNADFIWDPKSGDKYEYHALLIVGYNENTGKFKILNSWGDNWGNKGYALIPYDNLLDRTVECYICKENLASITEAIAPSAGVNITSDDSSFRIRNLSTSFNYNNFSLVIDTLDQTKNAVEFRLRDSVANDSMHLTFQRDGEEKQFYIDDTLVTVSTTVKGTSVWPNSLHVKLDSGRVDQNLAEMQAMLTDIYSQLKSNSDRSETDNELLNDFDNWNHHYRTRWLVKERWQWWVKYAVIMPALFILLAALYYYIVIRKRNHIRQANNNRPFNDNSEPPATLAD